MSQLAANDLVLTVNKRVLHNLAISRDHQFEDSVTRDVVLLELAAALNSQLAQWLNWGLEHPTEATANLQLLVPRLLYATSNGAFGQSFPGTTDLERLLNRLKRYDQIAPGPVAGTIPANAQIDGVPLDNPCPIVFKHDPDRRFTFLREHFFANNPSSFLEVTPQGIVMTITGKAHRGDLFSRRRAANNATHSFEMQIRYTVDFINHSDINLGPVPFQMVTAPPAPTSPGAPSLPDKDRFVFAWRFGGQDGMYVLPTRVQHPDPPHILIQPPGLKGDLFKGQLDDQIYETTDGEPIYRVEPHSDSEPQRFVIRKIGDSTILAEARAGRMLLKFDGLVSLNFTPNDVSPGEIAAIGASLSKINPTLAQVFTCDDIQGDLSLPLNLLNLLGPTSLDIPLMPRAVAVTADAQIVTQANQNQLGGPLNSVWSDVTTCDLTVAKYVPNSNPHQEIVGVAGKIGGNGDSSFGDFTVGADFAVGISQQFMQPMLDEAGSGVLAKIKQDPPPGMDQGTLQFTAAIAEGRLLIHVTGEGEIETPFFMPNIGYDFSATIYQRFRAQKAVVVDSDGNPRDRFSCLIPQQVLDSLGLNIGTNQLELSDASRNPLCFLGYNSAHNGIACFDGCPPLQRIPPPMLAANGDEIVVEDPDNPPDICQDDQHADDVQRLGQATFDLTLNPHLKHDWAIVPIPPTDDDMDVNVNVNAFALFFIGLIGALAPGLLVGLGPAGIALIPVVQIVLLTGLFLLPFTNLIASAIATGEVKDKLAEQNLPPVDPGTNLVSFLAIHLEDPAVRAPFTFQGFTGNQPGAFITRYHVEIQAATSNDGT